MQDSTRRQTKAESVQTQFAGNSSDLRKEDIVYVRRPYNTEKGEEQFVDYESLCDLESGT